MIETPCLVLTNYAPSEWHAPILARRQLIGRGSAADICVPRKFVGVSRCLAEVWADPPGFWICDVGSTAGTEVNGVRLQPHRGFLFLVGDHISLGGIDFDVVVQMLAPVAPTADSHDDTMNPFDRPLAALPSLSELSAAELEVVLWMGRGVTGLDEIGRKLFRSGNTVRTQLGSIFRKLGIHSRDELLARLRRNNVAGIVAH